MKFTTTLAVLAVLIVCTLAIRPKWHQLTADYSFTQYLKDFGKRYDNGEEYARRETLFVQKLKDVLAFNSQKHSYKKGINHMSDWTREEFRRINGRIPDGLVKQKPTIQKKQHKVSAAPNPISVDYRHAFPTILTGVKDQGQCGSCWAHAATEQLESYWAISTGNLFVLSQQQITSCTPNPNQCGGTGGCSGATVEVAWDYVSANQGITEEWMYGYQSYFGDVPTCAYNASKTTPFVTIGGYTAIERNDMGAVMDAIAHTGPLAISVEADTWGDYEYGVFTGCNYANNITMDHAVQLIGYGTDQDNGMDYWLVRNSWSGGWGEEGYIRLFKEKTGTAPECGWNNDWVTDGGGCKGQPQTVWACGQCGILYDTVYPNVESN